MGDRAVVRVRTEKMGDPIGVYLHWGGYHYADLVAQGLKAARPRWSDPTYGSRIVVSHLINHLHGEETGGGLFIGDDTWGAEHPIVEVDFPNQAVHVDLGEHGKTFTFQQFVEATEFHTRIQGWAWDEDE